MFFNLPVKIYEEKNCVYNHKNEIAGLGSHALIVTGKNSSKANGSLRDLTAAMDDTGVRYTIFDRVEENPSVETVMEARTAGNEAGADFVVGLGGGSPIDAAKAVSIMMCYPERGGEFLYEKEDDVRHLPVLAIPTTCGTGSEATAVAVLTVHKKRTKASLPHRVFPTLALVDSGYLRFAPRSIIIATAIDALAHLMESYINTGATPYVRMLVRSGLNTWSESRDALTGARELTDADYDNLIHASTLAGMAIAHDGTTIPHSLSYNITYEKKVAHGTAVGHFLPGYISEAGSADRSFVLDNAGFDNMKEFCEFIDKTCVVPELEKEILERSIQSVLGNDAKLKACPYELSYETLKRIAFYE